ncbi:hypothetical protein [Roseospira visakhapatnamensis]|uniref:Uncharacterized protein n=1 Tax=Roseospira visakhapatnamensis TaxID=390880 RepID=A0A7W6RDR1_9PROT|nr:hypothetical protein [Roseospira visakhapatnamensis]MBB4266442.1 hypothetical protein [Roseospira visakhapatnamensis]
MRQAKPSKRPLVADDDEGNKEALGCLVALALLAMIGAAVALFVDFDGQETEPESGGGELPITRVEALDEKRVVRDASGSMLARNLEAEPEDRGRIVARSGVVADLIARYARHGAEPEVIERELKHRSVCYNGRHARLVPLILDPQSQGFALSYGTADDAEGDPYPRLEFFHGLSGDLTHVYYVSLTRTPLSGFPAVGERIPNTRKAVGRVMLEWVAEVANTSCPPKRPAEAAGGSVQGGESR